MKNIFDEKLFFKLKSDGDRQNQKSPAVLWKQEKNRFTYNEIKNSKNIGMVIPEGYVVIDIDNEEWATKIYEAIKYEKIKCIVSRTGHGHHFLFKNSKLVMTQGSRLFFAGGFMGDVRTPEKGYVAIKFAPDKELLKNDGLRVVAYAGNRVYDLDEIDEVPIWMKLLANKGGTTAREIIDDRWEQGGRHDNFRSWVVILWKETITNKKDLYEVINFIDSYMSDAEYSHFKDGNDLKKQVDEWVEWAEENKDNRTNVTTFEQNEGMVFAEGVDVDYHMFNLKHNPRKNVSYVGLAVALINKLQIRYYQENFWIKKEGNHWYEKTKFWKINSLFIRDAGELAITRIVDAELKKSLIAKCETEETDDDKNLINFKNGRYDIRYKKLINYKEEEDLFLTSGLNFNYVDYDDKKIREENKDLIEWIETIFSDWAANKEDKDVLFKFIGLCAYSSNEFSKALFLYGNQAANGKSTYMSIITNIFSRTYVVGSTLKSLETTHGLAKIVGKKVITIDELQAEYIENNENFKSIITGDNLININQKYKDEFSIIPDQKVVAGLNIFPASKDKTDGFWRRIMIIPFRNKFTLEQRQVFLRLKHRLQDKEFLEYIIWRAIKGLEVIIENQDFTDTLNSLECRKQFQQQNNPILIWIEEKIKDLEGGTLGICYQDYREWCDNAGYSPKGRNKFASDVYEYSKELWKFEMRPGDPSQRLYYVGIPLEVEIQEEDVKEILDGIDF